MPPTGEDILRTLIELYEAQEQIKLEYEIVKGRCEYGDSMKLPTSKKD